jgi:hypothetical protein
MYYFKSNNFNIKSTVLNIKVIALKIASSFYNCTMHLNFIKFIIIEKGAQIYHHML